MSSSWLGNAVRRQLSERYATATPCGDATYEAGREGKLAGLGPGNLLNSDYNWGYISCNENARWANNARKLNHSRGRANTG